MSSNFFGKFNSFVNSANSGTTNEEFSFKYGALTSISAPRFINGNGKILFFNPKIALSWTGQENDIKGEYFKGPEELSWANVYSGEKIYSITESETGLSMSLGFTSQVFWNNSPRLEVSLAASKINGLTYSPASSFGLAGRKLNYLAKFFLKLRKTVLSLLMYFCRQRDDYLGAIFGENILMNKLTLGQDTKFLIKSWMIDYPTI